MIIKHCFKNHVRRFIKQNIVVKTNTMWPFCVRHHVDIHFDALVASITTDTQKNLITPQLPLLCIATKNEFGHHKISDQIFTFFITLFGDQKISITNFLLPKLVTEFYSLLQKNFVNCLKKFNHSISSYY